MPAAPLETVLVAEGQPASAERADVPVSARLYPFLPPGHGEGGDTIDFDLLLQQAEQMAQEQLVAPLVELALAQRNAVAGSTLLQLADVARLAHSLSLALHARRRHGLSAPGGGAVDPAWLQYLAILDKFGRLAAEVRAWIR